MNVLIKVQGITDAPGDLDTLDRFIAMIEEDHWYFGGGISDGNILGTDYA